MRMMWLAMNEQGSLMAGPAATHTLHERYKPVPEVD
jgi:hypothetical protein